jgi:hypothetical protein
MEWKMLVHFIPIWDELWPWYNLRPFGNFVVIWYIFHRFLYIVSRKIWQPCFKSIGLLVLML